MMQFIKQAYDIIKNLQLGSVISCVVTVLALVFTLYLWLIDHLNADEDSYIENKREYILKLEEYYSKVSRRECTVECFAQIVEEVNDLLFILLHYRFWERSIKKEDYKKMTNLYYDSKYLLSELVRIDETQYIKEQEGNKSDKEKMLLKSVMSESDVEGKLIVEIRNCYSDKIKDLIFFLKYMV